MLIKALIVLVMLIILYALGSGLFFLVRDKGNKNRTAKALTWRIGLSLTLFVLLFILALMGYIRPHGLA